MATADPTWMEDIFLEVNRYGFMEETHFTIAYSPVGCRLVFSFLLLAGQKPAYKVQKQSPLPREPCFCSSDFLAKEK